MSLSCPDLSLLDFDGTYEQQPRLAARFPHRRIDFRGLREASLYCSLDAFHVIRRSLPPARGTPVTLLGSGNRHFVALALIARLPRPFTLVLIDHHTDGAEGTAPAMISCGSWLNHAALRLPRLARVVMLGPPPDAAAHLRAALRARTVFLSGSTAVTPERLLAAIPTEDVYLSLDKDAFALSVARTNWDQGDLTLDAVLPLLTALARTHTVRGVDLCGEWPASPLELLRADVRAAIRQNETANTRLLETLFSAA